MADKIFADGLLVKLPRDGAPEFVLGSLSVKGDEFKKFIDEHVKVSGWLNIDLLIGKSGKPYAALNTYEVEKPESLKEDTIEYPAEEDNSSDVPF